MDVVLMTDPRVTAIPVTENGEALVDVRETGLRTSSYRADDQGEFARVRSGLAERLLAAERALPAGLRLLIIEGYRPPALQERYFGNYLGWLRREHPGRADGELRGLASRHVSPPDIAPHSAGAAVDLALCTDDGEALDFGTPVNATPEESGGACYTEHPGLDGAARENRSILGAALAGAGLVNYPTEWWHWSYGDRYWAMATAAPAAIYGPYRT